MPSHSERVRRNAHTITTKIMEDKPTNSMFVSLRISKAEIASWSTAKGLGQSLKRQIYEAVEKVLGK